VGEAADRAEELKQTPNVIPSRNIAIFEDTLPGKHNFPNAMTNMAKTLHPTRSSTPGVYPQP
jgi:hypothetical protein